MNVTDSARDPNTISVPLHHHELEKVEPLSIYQSYGGYWKCDNCNKENGPLNCPYNCKICSYDLCQDCSKGIKHLAHNHPLYYVNIPQLFASDWDCNVCSRSNTEIVQIYSLHCSVCNFDMCLSCATDKQYIIHRHPLTTVNTAIVYPHTDGNWGCDFCGRTSRFDERYSRHCSANCDFDACAHCLKEYSIACHPHPLVRADANFVYERFSGGWKCDNCGEVHNLVDDNKPWHCQQCEYDLCNNCMRQLHPNFYADGDVAGPPPTPGLRGLISNTTAIQNPYQERLNQQLDEPKEPVIAEHTNATNQASTEALDDSDDECIICTERPKNATVIHGDTGHLCCCWSCAQVLKKRGDPCPICRQKIDHVIKQFKA